ncbi:hypothetical protein B296_00028425 [Ensete ventricosum]|uniref:Uncharacterized protein n=1 Tax=Ensete ventricosum TaxID=4639 RepID=A0A427ALR3_ENSVE|nr:hypothetical protein B296_00028425 [Ensete ventricosum]
MEGALGFGSTSQRLARQISGREEMPRLESAASSCKKVGSGGIPDMTSPTVKLVQLLILRSLYSVELWRVDLAHLTRVRSVVRLLTPPCLCQTSSTVLCRVDHAGGLVVRGRGSQALSLSQSSAGWDSDTCPHKLTVCLVAKDI